MHTATYQISLDNGHSLFACEVTHGATTTKGTTANTAPRRSQQGEAGNGRDNINNRTHCDGVFVVIVVHGGPGLNSHKESFEGLKPLLLTAADPSSSTANTTAAATSRDPSCCPWIHAILFYDQLGCGASQGPPVPPQSANSNGDETTGLYSLAYYVDELQQVLQHTQQRFPGLKIGLLGHSWGGQIVVEYLLQQDTTTTTVLCHAATISNAPLNESTYEQKQQDIRRALPDDVRVFLELEEQEMAKNDASLGAAIYQKLIGMSDTAITGEMKNWNALARIQQSSSRLPCPCLFVAGTNDTIPHKEYESLVLERKTADSNASSSDGGGGFKAQVAILDHGDHAPFYGDTAQAYIHRIQAFLEGIC